MTDTTQTTNQAKDPYAGMNIEQALAMAQPDTVNQQPKDPYAGMNIEQALALAQPDSPKGGLLNTASHLANFYYGAARTEASKILSAFSSGWEDKWGAQQHQIDEHTKQLLANQKRSDGGNWLSHLEDLHDREWLAWNVMMRQAIDNPLTAGIHSVVNQAFSDASKLPSEEVLLKLGFKPEQVNEAYSILEKSKQVSSSFAGPVVKTILQHAIHGASPAAASLTLGELGAEAGTIAGGPIGGIAGGIGGGLVGYFGGQKAQDYLMSNIPDRWKALLGQTNKQLQQSEIKHPTAAFTGEMLPFAAPFNPGLAPKIVPQNASLLWKALAHPLGQRALSGVLMGDWEAVQELWNEGHTDSDKVAIAAAIGTFFPKGETARKVDLLNKNAKDPQISEAIIKARANGIIGSDLTPEQQKAKNLAIGNLNPDQTLNPQKPYTVQGPLSTEEAINLKVSQDYKIATAAGKQFVKAGRPADEASALGVLVQHYFETRAARFKGKLGTPQELFDREFPEILRQEKKAKEIPSELNQEEDSSKSFTTNPAKIADEHALEVARLEREGTEAAAKKNQPKEMELNQDAAETPVFYSALAKGVEGLKQKSASPNQWIQTIRNLKGVKKEELDWLDLENWLESQEGSKVSKADILQYLDEHRVNIQTVVKSDTPLTRDEHDEYRRLLELPIDEVTDLQQARIDELAEKLNQPVTENTTRFSKQVSAGGRDYRELLLTLHHKGSFSPEENSRFLELNNREDLSDQEQQEYTDLFNRRKISGSFYGPHFNEPDILANALFDTRTGSNGEKILHVAEIQSDWHQKGRRKGYKNNLSSDERKEYNHLVQLKEEILKTSRAKAEAKYGDPNDYLGLTIKESELIKEYDDKGGSKRLLELYDKQNIDGAPNAPFKTSWHELAFKRLLRYAAEHGFDRLSWDTGDTNADKYNLSKQVDEIRYDPYNNTLVASSVGRGDILAKRIAPEKLDDYIGKETADKIRDKINKNELDPRGDAVLKGLELKIGGEGMRGFYDKMLPDFARKYTKKWGSKVEDINIPIKRKQFIGENVPNEDGFVTENKSAHSVTITPEMRDSVLQGQPLFQGGHRGSLVIRDGKNLLNIFASSDASTVVHELGHDWLEALLRDAAHPEAPSELVNDAKVVRDWYNRRRGRGPEWVPGQPIPRPAHERWARGFERYLMEGVAPSKDLATIFAKFKAWLTKIYQSVTRLKAPITDDIRGVFDRLLSPALTRTVIDAAEEGAPKAPEEVPAQDQGSGVPTESGLPAETPQGDTEFAQSSILNKDGTFRIKQITGYDDLAKGVKAYITLNANKIAEAKDNITDEDTVKLAASMGLDPTKGKESLEKLNQMFGGPEVSLRGKMLAVGQYLKDSTSNLSQALINGNKEEIVLARQQLIAAMKSFDTARTDWGITGLVLQKLYREAEKAGALDQFYQSVMGKSEKAFDDEIARQTLLAQKKGITLEELARQQRLEAKPKIGAMISEYFRSMLITGIFTHAFYTEANKAWALWRAFPTTAAQALASSVIAPFSKAPMERVRWGELAEMAYSLKYAQADALKAVADSFKEGQSLGMTLPRVAAKKADYELANGIISQRDYTARVDYLIQNPTEEMLMKSLPPKNVLQSKAIPDNVKFLGLNIPVGSAVRVGGERMAAPMHSEAYVFMQQLKMNQLIYREAANKGLTGEALGKEIARLKYDTPLDIVKTSRDEALKATLLSGQSKLAKTLVGFSRTKLGLSEFQPYVFFEPFLSIAADTMNIAAFDASPLGLMSKEIRDNIRGKKGPIKQAESVGNMMLGFALLGTVYGWMSDGIFNGPAPENKKEAEVAKITGGYPYSFRFGNTAVSADRFGILGADISLMSDFLAVSQYTHPEDPWYQQMVTGLWGLTHTVGEHLLSGIGLLSGFGKIFDIARDEHSFEQWASKTLADFELGSIFLSQTNKEIEPYQRDVRADHDFFKLVLNQIKAQTPGLSETLPLRIDIFGQPVPNEKFMGVYVQQLQNDRVMQYFERHPHNFPSPVRQPSKFKLTPEDYEKYQMKAGAYLKTQLNNLIDDDFEQLPEELQHKEIQYLVKSARHQAIQEIQGSPAGQKYINQQYQTLQDMMK